MRINTLQLENFRNLAPQIINFESLVSLIVGQNGKGKTNILEAVYLLAQGNSFRSAKPKDLEQWNKSNAAITRIVGEVETDTGNKSICYEVKEGKRRILLNDKRVTLASSFYGQLCALEFTPDDLQIIKGAPAERRKLLDSVLSMTDSLYVDELVHYQRALKNRNALLQQGAKTFSKHNIAEQLRPWNSTLVESGLIVASKRHQLLQSISRDFKAIYHSLLKSQEPNSEFVDIAYESQFCVGEKIVDKHKAIEILESGLEKDIRMQKTSAGAQRDDVQFFLGSGDQRRVARGIASQGQARSMTLAVKLAAAHFVKDKVGEAPVLLLDDVESELDLVRKEALLEIVFALGCQVLISATEASNYLKNHLGEMCVFEVSEGLARRI